MKQDHYWQKGNSTPRQGLFSRFVGAALLVISAFVFLVAASATTAQVGGVLDILGIGLISLAITLLITGWTYQRSRSDEDTHL